MSPEAYTAPFESIRISMQPSGKTVGSVRRGCRRLQRSKNLQCTGGALREGETPCSIESLPTALKRIHRIQDQLTHTFVTHRGVNHDVEVMPRRPFHTEVLFNEV